MLSDMTTEEYDSIPVFYCKRCRSLLILSDPIAGDYCMECGSTEIGSALIENYLKLVNAKKKRYF